MLWIKLWQDCLKHYDYNAEAVINAILEDNLAPHLAERQFPDSQPIVPLPVELEEPAEISKKSRTKYFLFYAGLLFIYF